MATWKLSNYYKKSAIERQIWTNGDKVIIREEGFRWGTFYVECDERPLTDEELVNEDGYELGYIDDDVCWEMEEMMDGCWADTEAGRNCTEEDLEAFNEAWEENYYEGVEELGWTNDDTEFWFHGPLLLVNEDTGEEVNGESIKETMADKEPVESKTPHPIGTWPLNSTAAWPFGDPVANTVETAKWPFDRPYEGPKKEEE